MDPKELSAFLTPPKRTAGETLLVFTGGVIGLLLVTAGYRLHKLDYRHGILCFLAATLLGFVFFRKRKFVLVVSSLSGILGVCGPEFPFHPSFPALVLLLGSAAGLLLTIRWQCRKYPYLSFKHLHTAFEGEKAMAAENARIQAEAREFARTRPYGPWLFR